MQPRTALDNCLLSGFLSPFPLLLSLILLFAAAGSAAAIDYGAESNPTGDPIGGGVGYSAIVPRASATVVVSTKEELLSACATYKTAGQIIYVDDNAEINLSACNNIKIWQGVTLASGRGSNGSDGALLYSTSPVNFSYLFWAGGTGIRFTGLRIFGPDMEIGDHEYGEPFYTTEGIHASYSNLEVDNCELAGWGSDAIGLATPGMTGTHIHHNYIHHNRRNGLGYGVVLGSSTFTPIEALVEANLFDYNRHHIAGKGTAANSYEARYNLCLEHTFSHGFDMHGGADRGDGTDIAGDSITIHHNTFRDRYQTGVCIRGIPVSQAIMYNNWFYHDTEANAVSQINATGNFYPMNNFYGTAAPSGVTLPVAVPAADVVTGSAPLTVNFDGSGSYRSGGSISDYRWYLGDGSSAIGATAKNAHASYTFTDPGRYDVLLRVRDNNGITASSILPVIATPSSGSCILSLWVKDSYRGTVHPGYYMKAVLLDGTTVWSDDVAGDEGWEHVLVDVGDQVAGKNQVKLTLKTYCTKAITAAYEIVDMYVYWDDVVLFGFDTADGGFESPSSTAWTYAGKGSSWLGRYYTEDLRSGYSCYQMTYPYQTNCSVGYSAQISQTLTKTAVDAPRVLGATPAGNDVPAGTAVTAAFSKEMDHTAVQNAFSIVPVVDGGFSWSGNTLSFAPAAALRYGTRYTVTVSTAAKDLAGTALAEAYTWQFTVAKATLTVPGLTENSAVSGTVAVAADITDTDGITVDFYLDNILVATRNAPPFVWEWDTATAAAGRHMLRIVGHTTDTTISDRTITVHVLKTQNEVVYPNPYIKGKSGGGHKVTIANLPAASTVRIYTMAGEPVTTLPHGQASDGGSEEWDISSVPAGIYFYSITAEGRSARNGKIGIIK